MLPLVCCDAAEVCFFRVTRFSVVTPLAFSLAWILEVFTVSMLPFAALWYDCFESLIKESA